MSVLPGWTERLNKVAADKPPKAGYNLPKAPAYYAGRTTFVDSVEAAEGMTDYARQRPLSHIGFDTEFRYDSPGVEMGRGQVARDPRAVRPLLLSLALAEPTGPRGGTLATFVVDLRRLDVLPAVAELLRLPTCFVAHFAQAELICLFRLGLLEPRILWDTWVHEKALHLGRGHKKYRAARDADDAGLARAAEEAEAETEFSYALVSTCQRYGIEYPLAGEKERLQKSFLEHADGSPFTGEQVEYAAADAIAAARLYPAQVPEAVRTGILSHLQVVEMPWVATNARMVWRGVRIDQQLCRRAAEACDGHLTRLSTKLAEYGVPNVRSHPQLTKFFERLNLLDLFKRDGKVSFDKDLLADFADRHPAIPLIRAARRVHDLRKEQVLTDELVGADGRVHPDHRHLGTHTGRQTCRWPNLLGLGRVFRPLVVPDPGRGLGELDWSQIEVGIAAAVYGDAALVRMFNTGDVYSAMAQDFYRDRLTEADRALPGGKFKKAHPNLRNRMKTCTLGLIYGLTAHGLGQYLAVTPAEAAVVQARFLEMFPALQRELAMAGAVGGRRGYAVTASGLRRHRARGGAVTTWERNWMSNHPVQGSAAVVFKAAGNRLDRLYRRHDAWLVLPMHDAFVFEVPLESLDEVARLTERVMCETVQEWFPELAPRVEVNVERPECWNKDGHADSVERWMTDPTYTF